jgi:hypothetical protein
MVIVFKTEEKPIDDVERIRAKDFYPPYPYGPRGLI